MKKLLFGISLILLGGIIIGSALIAGGIYSSSVNQVGSTTSYDIFDSNIAVAFIFIGSIISIIGIVISILDIKNNEK